MSDHEIVWTFEGDYVNCQVVCNAPTNAVCHQIATCSCEDGYTLQRDDNGYFHYDGLEGEEHRHYTEDYCNTCEWMNADSPLECSADTVRPFELARTPIREVWNVRGSYMQWEPT